MRTEKEIEDLYDLWRERRKQFPEMKQWDTTAFELVEYVLGTPAPEWMADMILKENVPF